MKTTRFEYYFLFFLIVMSCNRTNKIDIQGHRGCRGLMPENTIPAFEKAIELGVHTLELDVVVSQDNIVVVSHEPFMNSEICLDVQGNLIPKSKELKYNLYQMEYDSIVRFDCGTKFHPYFPEQQKLKTSKPTLDSVLKTALKLNPKVRFNIEIKAIEDEYDIYTPKPQAFVRLVLAVLRTNKAMANTNLQSFDIGTLEEIRVQAPTMPVALLVDEDESIVEKIDKLSYQPQIISPYFKLLDEEIIGWLKMENYNIVPWTVNEIDDMKKMIEFGVDGIITDYPDRLISILN